uniref:Ubiquitin-like domain-containing protein n=1 Tax=Arion vulgaris TaxID=1028688 RepID=A0A0B6Y9S6_9EUPU
MQLFVRGLDNSTTTVNVAPSNTVGDVKGLLSAQEFVLSYGSKILAEDNVCLGELDITAGASLEINGRILGGKVHGSLARAGKVRAQTPKVAKQEGKKKKLVGRAFRRIQYNRRFSNVALSGPGRRRGPNSNAQ